jgi:ABC-type polysaccharide/polyol phosphate export permease
MRFRRMRLGVAWQFITLCLLLLSVGVVYATLFRADIRVFLVYLSASLILWTHVVNSMDAGCNSLVGSEGYIKQLPVPPLTYAFRAFASTTLSFLVTVPVFIVIKLVFQATFWWGMLWALPGLVLFVVVCGLFGASLSYLGARLRDIQPAVVAIMQVMFYVTPIIYMPEQLQNTKMAAIFLYNPFYHLLNIVRAPLIARVGPPLASYAVTGGLVACLVLVLLLAVRRYDHRIVYYL